LQKRESVRRWVIAGFICILLVGMVAFALRKPSVAWRIQLVARKAMGGFPELGWSELITIIRPGHQFEVKTALAQGRGLEAALKNPFNGPEDINSASAIFRTRCSVCHGSDAKGGRGPSLVRFNYQHGDSDFAIYSVLRDGVPGTAMVPTGLAAVQRWQMVGYLRHLQEQGQAQSPSPSQPQTHVLVNDGDLTTAGDNQNSWLTYSGSYAGWRYSRAAQISSDNVSSLKLRWVRQAPEIADKIEATPVVANDIVFLSVPPYVLALRAKSGEVLWEYERKIPDGLPICCGSVSRGVAIVGDSLLVGTLDAHLVSLDANSGRLRWDVGVADSAKGYTITGAPLAFGKKVVVGVSGGEFGARGLIAAFDVASGKLDWQFNTVPGPGSAGHETWKSEAWRNGGGAAWVTGSYDPSLNLLYWGIGNPSPVYSGEVRPGDNLFTDSVVALHADTGELAWHFQFTPHDEHDWDSAQTPVLADVPVAGVSRQLILWANRNGFFYALDRITGAYVRGTPFVQQTWAQYLDAKGRPVLTKSGEVSERGSVVFPGVGGGTNWQASAYDPGQQVYFVQASEGSSIFTKSTPDRVKHVDGRLYVGSGAAAASPTKVIVRALEAKTGNKVWEYPSPEGNDGGTSGLLATAGNLVFGCSGGILFAVDSKTGAELWRAALGAATYDPPIAVNIDGRETILVAAGRAIFAFTL
jgi:alcohol dehydrogenase (cytochrome c)